MSAGTIGGYADGDVVPVVVAGAGPAGVTAAAMLAARGVRTLVLDRWPDVYPLPRAVHIDDEIMRILQSTAGTRAVAPLMTPMLGLRLLDPGHRTMAEFRRDRPIGFHGHPQANMFDQPDLERVLRDHLATLPDAALAGQVEVLSVEQEVRPGGARETAEWPAPVRVRVRNLIDGAEHTLYAHAVLGCDGANSLVRDGIGARLLDLGYEERWFVVDVRTDHVLDAWDGVHQVCDPRRAATYMRVGPGRYRWEFRMLDGETTDDLLQPQRFGALLRPWTKDIPVGDLTVLRSAEYTFRARITDRWQDRRVFLLGDAAHLTPPFIGQGLCAALRDAANLTWKLAGVLQGHLDEAVLATYGAERAPHARALIRKAVTVGQVMTGGQDGAAAVRRSVLAALCRAPRLTARMLDTAPSRLTAGLLAEPARLGVTGSPVPQPWVIVDGDRRRLDTVLGPDFAVLTLDRPGPALQRAARTLGAPLVHVVCHRGPVIAPPGVMVAVDQDAVLAGWLRRHRVRSVVVRPDRAVLAQSPAADGGRALATTIGCWAWLLAPPPTAPAPTESAEPAVRSEPATATLRGDQ